MSGWFSSWRRPREPRWTPPVMPDFPKPDRRLRYAERAVDLAEARGYPVMMRQLDGYGRDIVNADEERFEDRESLLAFARRMDNILPTGYWAVRFAV